MDDTSPMIDKEEVVDEAISLPRHEPVYRDADLIVKIRELNPHIVCALCAGYFIDATTITECSHTFCKSCIVKHFQTKKSCPECGQKIHETQPLNNLRSDRVMQDVVYKLVPNLFKSEQEAEANFYRSKGIDFTQSGSHLLNIGTPLKYTSQKVTRDTSGTGVPAIDLAKIPNYKVAHKLQYDERVVIFMDMNKSMKQDCVETEFGITYNGITFKPLARKYIRCSSRVKVSHVKKLLKCTLLPDVSDSQIKIELFGQNTLLDDDLSLKQVFLSQYYSSDSPYINMSYRFLVQLQR